MKLTKYLFISFLLIATSSAIAQKKSPAKTVEGNIEATKIIIKYSSPSVKGREIFGGLEPWGKLWRAGANEATTIEFSTDVMINGKILEAGNYAFFITPKKDEKWDLTFNKEPKQWGAYKHDPSKNALVVKSSPKKIKLVESLTYGIENNKVYMDWANTRVSFTVVTLYEAE